MIWDFIVQWWHLPAAGSNWMVWATWILATLLAVSEYLGKSKFFAPNSLIEAVLTFMSGGFKAIKFNPDTGIVTIDVKELEALRASANPIPVAADTSTSQSTGVQAADAAEADRIQQQLKQSDV